MSFRLDCGIDLLSGAARIVGQRMALDPIENGPGAARAWGGGRGFSGGHQPSDRFAPIGNDDLFSSLDGFDELRQPVFGLQNIDLHNIVLCVTAMKASTPSYHGQVLLDRVEGPDGVADLRKELGGADFRAERAGVDEDDLAGDRLEGGAEMLHRLDRDGPVAGRFDAERGEPAEIDGLTVIGDGVSHRLL